MRTIVLSVMTWVGAVNAAQSSYLPGEKVEEPKLFVIPYEPWKQMLTCGQEILKDYNEFCSSLYSLGREAEVPEMCNLKSADDKSRIFGLLGGKCLHVTQHMETMRAGLPTNISVIRDDDGNRIAIVDRSRFLLVVNTSTQLATSADDMVQELTAAIERWIERARFVEKDKPETVREAKLDKLRELQGHKFIRTFQGKIMDLIRDISTAFKQMAFDPSNFDRILEEMFEKFASKMVGYKMTLERGLIVLGASFIKEGGLKDILEGIINDDAKFDAILETLRDYFGDEVLNPSYRALLSTSPSVSDQDDGPGPLFDLLMRPDLLEEKLMNLDKIFPPIGRTKVFRKLCRVFMMRFSKAMAERADELHSDDRRSTTINYFAIAYEHFSKKVKPNMNEGFDKRLKEVEGIKGFVTIALQLLLIVLKEPYNVYEKIGCRMLILQFLKETKAIIEKRSSAN